MITNRIYIIITSLLIVSCDTSEVCEGFNFKRIPFHKEYYLQNLVYTNGQDTITIIPEVKDNSKESFINPISNPDCSPCFSVYYEPEVANKLNLLYSFDYYPQDNYTMMSVILNSSRFQIVAYPTSKDTIFFINTFEHLNESDSNAMVKNVIMQNMNVCEFETILGEKWRLIRPYSCAGNVIN